MLVATFDIGTTAVKAVTVRDDGEPVFTGSQVIHTIEKNGFKGTEPGRMVQCFLRLIPCSYRLKYRPKTFPLLFFPVRCRM